MSARSATPSQPTTPLRSSTPAQSATSPGPQRQAPPIDGPSQCITKNHELAEKILTETHEMVWEWTKTEGPITDWPKRIKRELREAKSRGSIHKPIQGWRGHANIGKVLLKDLNDFASSSWPKDEGKLRDLV
jgi:hypothetical protein